MYYAVYMVWHVFTVWGVRIRRLVQKRRGKNEINTGMREGRKDGNHEQSLLYSLVFCFVVCPRHLNGETIDRNPLRSRIKSDYTISAKAPSMPASSWPAISKG